MSATQRAVRSRHTSRSVSNAACAHPSDSFHPLPAARVSGLLDPRDPELVRRQCELHTIVHFQLDPHVVEMGPNGGRGYAEPLSQFSVGETFRREQPKHFRLARRELAQHGHTAPLRFPSSGGGHYLRPRQRPNMDTPGETTLPPATGRSGSS